MTSIPAQLSNAFTEADRSSIEKWWSNLSEAARAETAVLCDERAENCFFGVVADERDHVIPKVHGGRFLHPATTRGDSMNGDRATSIISSPTRNWSWYGMRRNAPFIPGASAISRPGIAGETARFPRILYARSRPMTNV